MPEVPLEIVSMLLGQRVCTKNRNGKRVCIATNARSDGKIYLRVDVDGEKVAFAVFDPSDIIALVQPAIISMVAPEDTIEELWSILKNAKKKRNAKMRRKKRVDEDEEGEEEERVEEEEEEELEFA